MKFTFNNEILNGINCNNNNAWKALYDNYYGALCSYSCRIVGDKNIAEDVVQETLVAIWKNGKKFNTINEMSWYLYKSVYNNSLYYIRGTHNQQKIIKQNILNNEIIPDDDFSMLIREEMIRRLHSCISDMPSKQKQTILLTLEGKSGKEIAEIMGVSVNTIKTYKVRSIKYLRDNMRDLYALYLLLLLLK